MMHAEMSNSARQLNYSKKKNKRFCYAISFKHDAAIQLSCFTQNLNIFYHFKSDDHMHMFILYRYIMLYMSICICVYTIHCTIKSSEM